MSPTPAVLPSRSPTPSAATWLLAPGRGRGARQGNIDGLAKKYPLDSENRFGTKVSAKTSEVYTGTPLRTAEEFWQALSKGGTVRDIDTKNGPGKIAEFSDKSHVVLRPITSSSKKTGGDHPAVEIDIRTPGHGFPSRYKIHFTKGSKR